ncbi:MAG: serine protease [Treponema sp.]|jgi:hypothetical protein|nr:serine protease [Treponema sp.]
MRKAFLLLLLIMGFLASSFGQSPDSLGTGFFITGDGVIITCAHVIEGGSRITVKINNTEYPAEVLSVNSQTDLAVLKVNYQNPYHFRITDFSTTSLGDRLSVLGFPLPNILSSDIRFTEGSLSAYSGLKSDPIYFQHSAPTQPGNSGGPIMNSRFEVIGVAAAIINDSLVRTETGSNPQNINFGIKSEYINSLLANVRPGNGNIRSIADAERAVVQIFTYYQNTQVASINITNNTGYTVWYVYISPVSSSSWGEDRLRSDQVLRNGQSVTISSLPPSSNNRYDIRLVDSDDDSYTKMNVLVRQNQTIEFTFDDFDRAPSASAPEYDGPLITIVNNTGYEVWYVYISPTTSEYWGQDRLQSNQVLPNGQSVSLSLPHPLSVTDRYDIRLKDLDGDTYTKFNVTVTANGQVVFTFSDFD